MRGSNLGSDEALKAESKLIAGVLGAPSHDAALGRDKPSFHPNQRAISHISIQDACDQHWFDQDTSGTMLLSLK